MMKFFNLAAFVLAVALAIGLYRMKTEADTARARVVELERQVASAKAELKTLAAEVAVLESPARVEALAKQRLGLAPATPAQLRDRAEIAPNLPPARTQVADKPQTKPQNNSQNKPK
jgi:cell division protein FtsL